MAEKKTARPPASTRQTVQARPGPGRTGSPRPSPSRSGHDPGSQTLQFTAKNWRIFGAGIAAIVLGFILLGTGDITIAPVLLLAGYLVLIPWSLIARPSRPRTEGAPVAESPATPPSSAAEV